MEDWSTGMLVGNLCFLRFPYEPELVLRLAMRPLRVALLSHREASLGSIVMTNLDVNLAERGKSSDRRVVSQLVAWLPETRKHFIP